MFWIFIMKISQFFVSGFLIAGSLISATPSLASCYGSGYARYCDGIGGPGATYSPRGNYGSTNYYNRSGGYSRTETYTPQRNDTYYNGGGYKTRSRSRNGYGYSSGDYFGF